MSDWKPLYISLFLLLIVGGLVPYIMASFVDVNEFSQDYDGYLSPIISLVENGVEIKFSSVLQNTIPVIGNLVGNFIPDFVGFNLNPFSYLGGTIQNFFLTQVVGFALIPPLLAIPLLIILAMGFLYTTIKLVKPFS